MTRKISYAIDVTIVQKSFYFVNEKFFICTIGKQSVFEHFQQKGELAPLPPETIIRLTITTIAGFLLTRFLVMPDYPWDDEREMERTIQFLMNGLKA
ncbi:hypothetical protein P4S77_03750 [Anoxybacillus ayderensis]|nr:hypothetical protein [Anoxybacillus ayderensis]MED0686001.1 hypothetical protein [Anoxybacillus ayderensis]